MSKAVKMKSKLKKMNKKQKMKTKKRIKLTDTQWGLKFKARLLTIRVKKSVKGNLDPKRRKEQNCPKS